MPCKTDFADVKKQIRKFDSKEYANNRIPKNNVTYITYYAVKMTMIYVNWKRLSKRVKQQNIFSGENS